MCALVCRNILKTNDVRTGLKKPEQEAQQKAVSSQSAQLAEAGAAAAMSGAEASRHAILSSQAATASSTGDGESEAPAAPSEWDLASAARDRYAQQGCCLDAALLVLHYASNQQIRLGVVARD